MKNKNYADDLQAEKRALELELMQSEYLIRQDLKDIKSDVSPFGKVGGIVKNLLFPATNVKLTGSNVVNLGLDAGLNLLSKRLITNPYLVGLRVLVPVVAKTLATHAVPKAKSGLIGFLEWVVEKTEAPEPKLKNAEPPKLLASENPIQTWPPDSQQIAPEYSRYAAS